MSSLPPDHVPFRLQEGFRDAAGARHTAGVMRPATVRDEALALGDFRVHLWPGSFLDVVLARVIVSAGTLGRVDAGQVAALGEEDRSSLAALYARVNAHDPA